MLGDMRDLAAFVDGLTPKIKEAVNERKQQAVLAITNELTQATPIDTGRAISNWKVSVGEPDLSVIAPHVPSRLGYIDLALHSRAQAENLIGAERDAVGLTGLHSGDGGPANAQAAMDAARTVTATAEFGQTVYIANATPYLDRLNTDGISPQASPGFVERAILSGVYSADRAKLNL